MRCYGDDTFDTHSKLWKHLIGCFKRQEAVRLPSEPVAQLFLENGLEEADESSCWVCGTTSKHNAQLGLFHLNTCVTCEAPYNSWAGHRRHVAEAHAGVMLVRCPQCAQVFKTEAELGRHKRTEHGRKRVDDENSAANRDVTCDQCGVIMKVHKGDSINILFKQVHDICKLSSLFLCPTAS